MKKSLLLIAFLLPAFILQAADWRQKREERVRNISLPAPQAIEDVVVINNQPNPFVSNLKFGPDVVIGKTRYDLQSNYAMARRMHLFPDGSIGATWTYGMLDPNFTDRGTAYNYFNGTTWGAQPSARVEPVRTGWPSYAPWGPNGEIIVSHTGTANGLIFSRRATKGTGPWTNSYLAGPSQVPNLLWPRMITSGENNEIIHVIALTAPTANGGVVYQGLDGALLYSRSTDGGQTWNPQNALLTGITAQDLLRVRADTYAWAAPFGNTIAFLVGDGYGDGIVMKSDDAGLSWEKMLYYESIDKFMDGNTTYPIHGGTDSYQHAVIDDQGRVHVAVGRQIHRAEAGLFYYPYSNGLLYWNETMAPLDTTKVASGITDVSGVAPGYLLAELIETATDTLSSLLTPNYYASLTSMPQLVFDYEKKILYAFYSAITPGYVNNDGQNYRHIWMRFSEDYGQTWSPHTDLHNDIFHLFTECVYPSASSTVNNKVHLIYQSDNFIGGSNRPTPPAHGHVDNDIVYLTIDRIITGANEKPASVLSIDKVYPNPARNEAFVTIRVDKPLTARISLVNLVGQEVQSTNQDFNYIGTHRAALDLSRIDRGVYFVRVANGNQIVTQKIIVH